ncbi:unnamed protein product [Cylindrotheca closterium]|uniref:Uncharacterized protein n=1 Tax=Cylindrotheca closterium TaxID=2856 RepID=A0AAD2G579_9STRA|nr:unnamed protein product [Cylindrotheca closterium]
MMLRQQLLKYQHQQRLLFSTTAKRRRKKPKLPSTTKDRLRRVAPPGNRIQKENRIDSELVTERLQTRLDWVRSNIESLWKDPNAASRPDRYEISMDGNWWKWNLLLALTPGMLIAAYCEFVAKPTMLEQRKVEGSSGLPQPNSSSFLEDLYDGLMHYLYGMEPTNNNQIQSETPTNNTISGDSMQRDDLQQLQALKDQIKDLEDRMNAADISTSPRPGVRQRRHQRNNVHKPKEEPPSDNSADKSSPSMAGWILQTMTESLGMIQETANTVLFPSPDTQGKDKEDASNANTDNATASITGDEEDDDAANLSNEEQLSSSQYENKKKQDGGVTIDEFENSSRRRWWQLWK